MRAVALLEPDGRLEATSLPDPQPEARELLVHVRAASINPVDVRVSTGRYPWGKYDYPVVPGFDFSGVVARVGEGVGRFRVGDEVFGYWSAKRFHRGSWAEFMTVPEDAFVAAKPPTLSFDLAAATPLAAVTALMCVDAVAPLHGETVLVVGAGGAIGAYVLQLAAAAGATVVATGKPGHDGRLRGLGAGHVVDYVSDDVATAVGGIAPGGIAALIDLANDREGVTELSRVVRDGGRLVSACFGADPQTLALREISSSNVVTTHADPGTLRRLMDLIEAGSLRIGYDELRPLDEVPAVVEEISAGPSRKTVVDVALQAS